MNIENTQLLEIEKLKRASEKRKRRFPFKTLLAILFLIFSIFYFQADSVIVKNNTIYSDKQVMEITTIEPGKSMILQFQFMANYHLINDPLIESVSIAKDYLDKEITIDVVEKQYLGIIKNGDKSYLVLEDGSVTEIGPDEYYDAPIIYADGFEKTELEELVNQLSELNSNVIGFISEISYYDEQTDIVLQIKMTDHNTVYVNLNELAYKLKFYPELKMTTNGKTGTFYLHNGDYFKPY